MKDITITSLKCPRCGHPLSNYDGLSAIVTCPECGEIVHISGLEKERKNQTISKILLFSVSKDSFEERLEKALIGDDSVPLTVFTESSFDVKQYYVPMHVYSGTYKADYQYSRGYKTYVYSKILDKNIPKTEYLEDSDHCKGSFCLSAPACNISDGASIPKAIFAALKNWGWTFGNSKEFSSTYLKDIDNLVCPKIEREMQESWSADNLSSRLHKIAERNIIKRLDNLPDQSSLLGSKWKNMRFDLEMDDVSHDIYLVPLWFAEYTYKGAKYYAVASGCSENMEFSAPKDYSNKSVESEFKKKWRVPTLMGVFSFLCLAIVGLGLNVMGEDSWLMAFIFADFSILWGAFVAGIRKMKWKQIMNSNSSARQKAISKLKSGTPLTDNDISFYYDDCSKARKILIYVAIILSIAGIVFIVSMATELSSTANRSSITQYSKPETDWFLSGDMSALPLVTATTSVVNIRAEKSAEAAIVGHLKKGEHGVVLVWEEDEWDCVCYGGHIAYIRAMYTYVSKPISKRQMVVLIDNNETFEYFGETSTHYCCASQDLCWIDKRKAKIVVFSAENGDGVVAIKNDQTSAPGVFSNYSPSSELISHLPLDEEGYLPEPYKCLGYKNHMFLVAYDGSEGSGWVSDKCVDWYPACNW